MGLCVCHRSAPAAPSSLASQSRPPAGPSSSPVRPAGLSAPNLSEDSRYTTHTHTHLHIFTPTSDLRATKQLTFPQSPFLLYIISWDMFNLAASVYNLHLHFYTHPGSNIKVFIPSSKLKHSGSWRASGNLEDVCVGARKCRFMTIGAFVSPVCELRDSKQARKYKTTPVKYACPQDI